MKDSSRGAGGWGKCKGSSGGAIAYGARSMNACDVSLKGGGMPSSLSGDDRSEDTETRGVVTAALSE